MVCWGVQAVQGEGTRHFKLRQTDLMAGKHGVVSWLATSVGSGGLKQKQSRQVGGRSIRGCRLYTAAQQWGEECHA